MSRKKKRDPAPQLQGVELPIEELTAIIQRAQVGPISASESAKLQALVETFALLPEIARALADYLQHGRPKHASMRAVFVATRCPHQALSSATIMSDRIERYAARAGVEAEFLGSHALRHSHASRQLEIGTPPEIIADILGHADPQSTGVYLRSALAKLRQLALPVPQ